MRLSVETVFFCRSATGSSKLISPDDCPARCRILRQPCGKRRTTLDPDRSSCTNSMSAGTLAMLPPERSSTPTTAHPSSRNLRATCEPMKPATPLINTVATGLIPGSRRSDAAYERVALADPDELPLVGVLQVLSQQVRESAETAGAAIACPDHVIGQIVALLTEDFVWPPETLQQVLQRCFAEVPGVRDRPVEPFERRDVID